MPITLTSSVMRVAMERPISWYWGPFPIGPSRMKRNLHNDKGLKSELGGTSLCKMNLNDWDILCVFFFFCTDHSALTWWWWEPLPGRWAAQRETDGWRPPQVSPETLAHPPGCWMPQPPVGFSSWSGDLSADTKTCFLSNTTFFKPSTLTLSWYYNCWYEPLSVDKACL